MGTDYFVTGGEFDRTTRLLSEQIKTGFESMSERFDRIEPKIDQHSKDIVALQASRKWRSVFAGGISASGIVGVLEAIRSFFHSGAK